MANKITKVLLVDDDSAMNYVNEFFIKHYNFCQEVIVEQYPEDAITMLKAWALQPDELPQIIFLDMNMPVMNGLQFAEEMQKHIPAELISNIQVYILSSSDISSELRAVVNMPFVKGYLSKPIQIEDLQKIFV
jgi:CheY-like chemotaxis protein